MGKVKRRIELSPKGYKFYRIAKSMVQKVRQLFDENASNKQRLEEAEKVANSEEFLKWKVNNATWHFIQFQLKHQIKSSRGCRFFNKIFGLSLLK